MELNTLPDYTKTIFNLHSNHQNHWSSLVNSGMEENNDYFDWSNEMKIQEEKMENFVNKLEPKIMRKRKNSENHEGTKFKPLNGCKELRVQNENINSEKQNATENVQNGSTRMPAWQIDDISELNADLEGSFTNLRTDLANNAYNMSEAILNIPGLPIFKQEAPSPTSNELSNGQNRKSQNTPILHISTNQINRNINDSNDNNSNGLGNNLHNLLNGANYSNFQNSVDCNLLTSTNVSQDGFNNVTSSSTTFPEDCRFQYVLAAATSIATKLNEDTLTYLNQGQSYEIKAKKLGDLSTYRGKLLKSVIRVCFHERRLQYMEKEQMKLWQKSRPGDRILEIDVPLSYGLCEVSQPANSLNTVCFSWDPTKEVGIYIKVNCISTEFTPRKHGGEKGVPFRLQVETYYGNNESENIRRLHVAACQIKVFKLKGADRKHKQDREKILKRPVSEQEKFQPSYECTVLNDMPLDAFSGFPAPEIPIRSYSPEGSDKSPSPVQNNTDNGNLISTNYSSLSTINTVDNRQEEEPDEDNFLQLSDPEDVLKWLNSNRFGKYLDMFSNFSGSDMLRMTREDLIQICGQADGIRLYNALHNRALLPKLTLFVCNGNASIFNAVYLTSHSKSEMLAKIAPFSTLSANQIKEMYIQGPQGIKVNITTEVIRHLKDEAMFLLMSVEEHDECYLLLKSLSK
ncbi:transcription factor CP2 isoform X2 [Agrilus planipennis]|uniref:Transcription factor CP2 isoform X2 n=1 Tax=Agrilus planipennis TaxID=224129 RepID=A0A7F5RJZ4_AGRPL|nr:transcription factor CP2 isoform X2 [Agrilus planipennis]